MPILPGGVEAPPGVSAMLNEQQRGYNQPAVIKEVSMDGLLLFGMTPLDPGTVLDCKLFLLTVRLPAGLVPAGEVPSFKVQVQPAPEPHTMFVAYAGLLPDQRAVTDALYRALALGR